MRTIPSVFITEKNKPQSAYPWVTLLDVQIDASTWIYLTNYDAIYEYFKQFHDDWVGDRDKIIFPHSGGSAYEYFPFALDIVKESSTGRIDSLGVSVDNSDRQMEAFIHQNDLIGNEIILRVVNLNYMESADNQIVDYFKILGITSGRMVIFSLGHLGLINKRFGRTITRTCTFRFQDSYCGFAGSSAEVCKRILGDVSDPETCKGKGNTLRYGGFPNARGFLKYV